MSWQRRAPTQAGFYWWRHASTDQPKILEVIVDERFPAVILHAMGDEMTMYTEDMDGEYWYPAIEQPPS